jgi:hypothetical protein
MPSLLHSQMIETNKVNALKDRLAEALELAKDSFWKTFADQFPEAQSGDLSPDATSKFDKVVKQTAAVWLWSNYPTQRELLVREANEIVCSPSPDLNLVSDKLNEFDSTPDDYWELFQNPDGEDLTQIQEDDED